MKNIFCIAYFIFLLLIVLDKASNLANLKLFNVTGEVVKFQGKDVLKIERDLKAFPFDINRLEATVDDIHYARLEGLDDFENGTIEVKMYSQIQNPSPFAGAAVLLGFIIESKITTRRLSLFIFVQK
jgi:hypothetical protein